MKVGRRVSPKQDSGFPGPLTEVPDRPAGQCAFNAGSKGAMLFVP